MHCKKKEKEKKRCQYIYQANSRELFPAVRIFGPTPSVSLSLGSPEGHEKVAYCQRFALAVSRVRSLSDGSQRSAKSCLCASVSKHTHVCSLRSRVQKHLTLGDHMHLCTIS